jgi:outer membrane receptor protein involved in Fe transport
MVRYFLLSLSFLLVSVFSIAQTSLQGKVTVGETGEELISANIVLKKEGVFIVGVSTDFNGNYSVNVDEGTYDVTVSYLGYPDNLIQGVVIKPGQSNKLDIKMAEQGIIINEIVVTEYRVPLIEVDNTTQGKTITAEEIRNLPTRDVSALASTAAGLSQIDEGAAVTVRGSRTDATDYYIDGVRVRGVGSMIPSSEIDQLQVITGGIQAQYGDVTGGIISITTKGPSSRFSGGADLETSEYLDAFGSNLASLNLSGPILRKKATTEGGPRESIIGFRVASQYFSKKDDNPPATDIFVVKDEVLKELEANPVSVVSGSIVPTAQETLTAESVDVLKYRPNEKSERLDVTGKIDARFSKAIDVTLTGSYSDSKNKFTPGGWRLMNSQNNPTTNTSVYRGNFRFRHRLGGNSTAVNDSGEAVKKTSVIRNAQYTLQFGYEKTLFDVANPVHGDNYFRYGYIGEFDIEQTPTYGPERDSTGAIIGFLHTGYNQTFTGYTPGDANPVLVNYNNVIEDANSVEDFVVTNGQFFNTVTSIWTGMHTNVGQVYNTAQKRDNDLYTFVANSSFDFLPGGSEKGRHSIQFGFFYEQRFERLHSINPFGLWRVARLQANRNINSGLNNMDTIGYAPSGLPFPNDTLPLFNTNLTPGVDDLLFWQNVRTLTGKGVNEFVNVDMINPDDLSLDMFSAKELMDQINLIGLNYYGYSYTGQKLGNDVKFDDFFSATDERGIRTFPVAAFQPIYSAAYIQDKFTFKDIIFRVGVRVDRYDANTKQMIDPYSLYEVMNASDFYASVGSERPAGVEDDYLIYTTSETSDAVQAFRKGDQWYFANGEAANSGNLVFNGKPAIPRLKNPNADIQSKGFDTKDSFKDYEPQVNWMPRLAFSFPISDVANFFAHYDVLVQRPTNTIATPLDFFYFEDRPGTENNPIANPGLRPQRTIDYEVGFQQKLSNSSALKVSAYYKEMRDLIQQRVYTNVAIVSGTYVTYDNQDFGTVKGFSFQYDLRRTNNVMVTANYTLQFADGTGSNANSQRGIQSRGNLRTLFPLSFDERHRIVATIDYRYASGSRYNGPRIGGKDILSDFGVNFQAITVSGRPYTATSLPVPFGGQGISGAINGSRLPWNFTLNLRVDKSFNLTKRTAKRQVGVNVYFRIQNLLDNRNVLAVYSASGDPDDDGFLSSSNGQETVSELENSGQNIDAYFASYSWRIANPGFFSLPRRIFLGAIFNF